MARLHAALGNWVQSKVDTDPNWQGRRIYLSGHNVANLLITFKLRFLKGFELLFFYLLILSALEKASTRSWTSFGRRRNRRGTTPTRGTACTGSTRIW